MSGESRLAPTLLERLDLALVSRLVHATAADDEMLATAQRFQDRIYRRTSNDARFIASLLRLRGLAVLDDDASDVLSGATSRFQPNCQEFQLIRGLQDVLQILRDRASRGTPPDGWFLVELFKAMTRGLPRFRNNVLRVDPPWDAILYVRYPLPQELNYLLDTFDESHRYRDFPRLFDDLHPVRQGFRILWRFARLAPFVDFNVPMGWLAMCSWLLARGYPLLTPDPLDQAFLVRLISGPPPTKIVQFESRLLDTVESFGAGG
jgi:hypothetical protein